MKYIEIDPAISTLEADIVVPKELRIRPAKRKQGMRHSGGGATPTNTLQFQDAK